MTDPDAAARLDAALAGRANAPRLLTGPEGLKELAAMDGPDVVLNSVVGIAGLGASLTAIESGHDLALANKESLVTGGHLVTRAVAQHGVKLLPVDSEHSAIFQCLQDKESAKSLTKILLTASGGPFFGMKTEELRTKTKADALKHPNWNMGAKITIDSATLMNKGLELIEAVWLFGLPPEKIQIVVQRQSIVHSAVQFSDNRSLLSWVCRICAFPSSMRSPTQSAYPALCRSWTLLHSRCSPSMWQTTRPSAALPPAKRPSKRAVSAPVPPTVPMRKLLSSSLRTKLASSILAVWWKQSWTATALAASIPSAMCTSATAWHGNL